MIFLKRLFLSLFLCWPLIGLAETKVDAPTPNVQQSLKTQFERAVWLLNQQQWQAAASVFNQLLENKPQWVEAQNNLAVARLKAGDIDAARNALEAAVIALPTFKIAQQNRQLLYDYLAANAYDKALGQTSERTLPVLTILPWPALATKLEPSPVNHVKPLQQQINKWAAAWSKGDVEAYFSVYAENFQPQKNIATNYNEWHRSRWIKLKRADKPMIEINHKQIFINAEKDSAIVEFVQHYRAKHYADTVIKQLSFVLQKGVWLIQTERVLEQLSP